MKSETQSSLCKLQVTKSDSEHILTEISNYVFFTLDYQLEKLSTKITNHLNIC